MNGAPGAPGTIVQFLASNGTSTSLTSDCAAPTATVSLPAHSHFQARVNGYNVQESTAAFLPGVAVIFTPFNPADAGITNWIQQVYTPSTSVTFIPQVIGVQDSYSALFFPDSGVTAVGYPLQMLLYTDNSPGYTAVEEPAYGGITLDGTTTNAAFMSISGSSACSATCATGYGTCEGVANGWIAGTVLTQPVAGP
jgi:hypothetical protein